MNYIKSTDRVRNYSEVFTAPREVSAMIDLIKINAINLEYRILEPGCGTGNFLVEILRLRMNEFKGCCPEEKKKFYLKSIESLYGIDILEDNIEECKKNLLNESPDADVKFHEIVTDILNKNITCEDFLGKNISISFFDIIIGNPPYHTPNNGYAKSSSCLYDKFFIKSKSLNPKYIVMIIPSRWFGCSTRHEKFRKEILSESRIRKLVDFCDSRECFRKVDIAGGVCYFLWDSEYSGHCEFISKFQDKESVSFRSLIEFDTIIRYDKAISIIKKIQSRSQSFMNEWVTFCCPFGLETNHPFSDRAELTVISAKRTGKIELEKITKGKKYIYQWKVFVSQLTHDTAARPKKNGKRGVICRILIGPPCHVCTRSFLIAGSFDDKNKAYNLSAYLKTKFVRFLVSLCSTSTQITKGHFVFVPNQDYSHEWTDEELYKKYELTQEEIDFIENSITEFPICLNS